METDKQLYRIIAFGNFVLNFGFNIWQAVFNNFAVENVGVRADQIGLIQSIREIPGLLGFLLGFLALFLPEMRVLGASLLMMGVGIAMTGLTQGFPLLIVSTFVMSVGFHFFYPSSSSLVLMNTKKENTPRILGKLNSLSSFAAVVGTIFIWLFVKGLDLGPIHIIPWGYRTTYVLTGAVVILGSLFAIRNGRRYKMPLEKRKVVFRRSYWLYYVLTFLMGSRRHIFTTFAIFLLVQVHGIDVRQTAVLFLVNSLVNTYTMAQLGKVVARFGERRVLTFNFIGLIGVFLGYAYLDSLPMLYVLFVLDNIFFGFNLAVDSYFQKIAQSTEEITSNISMAQTISHISALIVPVMGGLLWELVSPAATFLAGVGIVAIALVLVQFIRPYPAASLKPTLVE